MTAITSRTYADLVAPLSKLDWEDLHTVDTVATELLHHLDLKRGVLYGLVARITDDPHLCALCEHSDVLDVLVLHDDPAGWQLRLHVFLDDYFERPHNHRWTYTSCILDGFYTHILYGTDMAALTPGLVRVEELGSTYTLHHNMIHAMTAVWETVTLIVRGPAVKVSEQTTTAKRMTKQEITRRVRSLKATGMFAA